MSPIHSKRWGTAYKGSQSMLSTLSLLSFTKKNFVPYFPAAFHPKTSCKAFLTSPIVTRHMHSFSVTMWLQRHGYSEYHTVKQRNPLLALNLTINQKKKFLAKNNIWKTRKTQGTEFSKFSESVTFKLQWKSLSRKSNVKIFNAKYKTHDWQRKHQAEETKTRQDKTSGFRDKLHVTTMQLKKKMRAEFQLNILCNHNSYPTARLLNLWKTDFRKHYYLSNWAALHVLRGLQLFSITQHREKPTLRRNVKCLSARRLMRYISNTARQAKQKSRW